MAGSYSEKTPLLGPNIYPSSSSINRSESDEVAFLMPSQAPLSINSVYQPKAAEQRLVSLTNSPVNPTQPITSGLNPFTPEKKPDTHLDLSICSFLSCCCICGAIAILYGSKVEGAWKSGDYEEAHKHSLAALRWSKLAIAVGTVLRVLGTIVIIVYFCFFYKLN